MTPGRSGVPDSKDPHAGQQVVTSGPPPERAAGAIVLIHGRGASAADLLGLYNVLGETSLAALAPQAAGSTWYPNSFLAPVESNQPYLDSALRRIESVITDLLARGVREDRVFLLGFSQGACLTSEFMARHPRRYGGAIAFTGGLIGPPGTPRNYPGSLDGTPVFLGTSDPDPHVPFARVEETRDVLQRMGAIVELRRYAGMPHTVNQDEMDAARELIHSALSGR